METIRFNRKIGRIVQLVGFVLKDDIIIFLIFFVFWVVIFAFAFRILGNNVEPLAKDKNMDTYNQYFLHSWSQAVRSGKDPDTSIWRKLRKEGKLGEEDANYSIAMIGINWAIQLVNEFLMKIVLFSFLIGLVGRSLGASITNYAQNQFKQQCEMNRESSLMQRSFGFLHETGIYVISADMTEKQSPDQQKMKKLEKENTKLKEMNRELT